MIVLCLRCRRSNMRTEPFAPTEANVSLPPPARLNEMLYTCDTSRQWPTWVCHSNMFVLKDSASIKFDGSSNNFYLLVMSYELCLDVTCHQVDPPQHLPSLQPPDCTGGVYTGSTCTEKNNNIHSQHFLFSVSNIVIWVYRLNALRFLPNKFGSTSFQSKDVSCAQKSEFLLLLSRHSRRVSLSLTCQSTKHHCLNLTSCSNTIDSIKDELSFQVWKSSQSERA